MILRRLVILGAALALAACGAPGGGLVGGPPSGGFAAREAAEPPLDQPPRARVVVPSAPRRAPHPLSGGNKATLHVSPAETLPALKALIQGARRSIYLETFNFAYDSYGRQLVPLLVAKAQAGLEVKVLMDFVGSRTKEGHKELVETLREGGVDVEVFMPRAVFKQGRLQGINATHRKVYLADGERALIGGVNLKAPFDTTTQDILIGWRGPVVAQIYEEFAIDWRSAGGGKPSQTVSAPEGLFGVAAKVVVTSPAEGRFEARDAIYQALDGAEREILVEQQFLMDDPLMRRLVAAAARGVRVRVLIPEASHGALFKNIHTEELNRIVKAGGEARVYRGVTPDAHLHVKYFSVDDRWATAGSTNGDTRGFLDNQELNLVTTDTGLVRELRARLFEHDWTRASEPFEYRPGGWYSRPVRNLLELIDYYL